MNGGHYLLDTNVLLYWLRGGPVSTNINGQFGIMESSFRPMISEVTLGELQAFAMDSRWGEAKKKKLSEIQKQLLVIDLTSEQVYRAYAEYSTLAKTQGWPIFHDKNDLWIAASAKVTGATVLTTDAKAFKPLRDSKHLNAVILDPKTGWKMQ